MKPAEFQYSNKLLLPSGAEYSGNVTGVEALHVWTDGEQCVSLWRPSLFERLNILIFGRVWLATLSGNTQPPARIDGCREYIGKDSK